MRTLPVLGIGIMWFAGLDHLLTGVHECVDYYEFEPAVSTLHGRRLPGDLHQLRDRGKPMLVHDVTCSVGTSARPSPGDVDALVRVAHAVSSPWVSTHLSVDRLPDGSGGTEAAGFLLPPAQTEASVRQVARNICTLRDAIGLDVAVETGVNYLQPSAAEMPDGEFFAAVAEEADCLLLCDLHNLWCNERNGRQPLREVMGALPRERVCEIHLAGGQEHAGYLLDAHSGLIDPRLTDLAEEVIADLPAVRAITFELMPDYAIAGSMTPDDLASQMDVLRRLWVARPSGGPTPIPIRAGAVAGFTGSASSDDGDAMREYESGLRARLRGPADGTADPGLAVYRDLIATMRLGNIVDAVPLTYRMLVLDRGWQEADRLCEDYLSRSAPCAWAHQEAQQFAEYLREGGYGKHLDDVLRFEFAAREAAVTGRSVTIEMCCDPNTLLPPLRAGRHPGLPTPGRYRVVVSP